ncbi:hypothetical protein G9A89_017682 [Geosiphon pyriformis]|nr:hypothetical protein G9A89_017682 [Geosiphon pyriformis]
MTNAKIEDALPSEILEIKNNSPKPVEVVLIPNFDVFLDIETGPKEFYKHYQNLALTQKEQKQIYTIPKEEEPISSCTLESNSTFNPNSNLNDNNNNDSSSVQNGNSDNNNNLNLDSDSKQYIVLSDLSKKQKLRWFSDNNEGIMPKCVHNTNIVFDLRYLKKDVIKLESHLCTCIDLKVALKIPATTIIQLASKSNLVKKRISIKREIIDTRYVGNIIAMLQNDSEKAYYRAKQKDSTNNIPASD